MEDNRPSKMQELLDSIKTQEQEESNPQTTEAKEVEEVLQSMRHEHETKQSPYKLKLRNWLNSIFIVLALATVVIYFVYPLPDGQIALFATCSLAIMVKMTEATIRITRKRPKTK